MKIKQVMDYWNKQPCNIERGRPYKLWTKEYFDHVEKVRYECEPVIPKFANFAEWKGKRILEVGCGIGTELINFARASADVTGIDVSENSISKAGQRLELYGLKGRTIWMNGEFMRFADNSFDLVYSWGVIHHSAHPPLVVNEINRVLKHGGVFRGMVYHKYSAMVLAVWLRDVIRHKNPFVTLDKALSRSMESPGTKAYSYNEIRQLFGCLGELKLTPDFSAEYMRIMNTPFVHILKVYPKALASWVCVEGIKIG